MKTKSNKIDSELLKLFCHYYIVTVEKIKLLEYQLDRSPWFAVFTSFYSINTPSHHGWFQATKVTALNAGLERNTQNQFLQICTKQSQCMTASYPWGHHPVRTSNLTRWRGSMERSPTSRRFSSHSDLGYRKKAYRRLQTQPLSDCSCIEDPEGELVSSVQSPHSILRDVTSHIL